MKKYDFFNRPDMLNGGWVLFLIGVLSLIAIAAASVTCGTSGGNTAATAPNRMGRSQSTVASRYIQSGQWLADARTVMAAVRFLFEADIGPAEGLLAGPNVAMPTKAGASAPPA
jgi:hypothetical protein